MGQRYNLRRGIEKESCLVDEFSALLNRLSVRLLCVANAKFAFLSMFLKTQ
jgi:hypothetical protein